MKSLVATLLCVLSLSSNQSALAADNQDTTAIKGVFSRFSTIWDQPGMPGFGDLFSEDADFVVITGKWLKGRSEIVSYHKNLLATFYKGSRSIPMETVAIRFFGPNVAIAHVTSGAHYTQDGVEHIRTALATAAPVKRNGTWQISAFHNTLTGGPGYAFGTPPPTPSSPTSSDHHLVDCPDSPTMGKRPPDAGCASSPARRSAPCQAVQ